MKIKWHNENKFHMQVKENNGVTFLTYPYFEQFPDLCIVSVQDLAV